MAISAADQRDGPDVSDEQQCQASRAEDPSDQILAPWSPRIKLTGGTFHRIGQ
jgi:hypothetical protein